jgi:hypothetical protein
LCEGLDRLGFDSREDPSGEQCLDAGAEARPVLPGQFEVAAEVEQGDLTDLLAGAFGGDQPVGVI